MNRPHYAHANQRSFYRLDAMLDELVQQAQQEQQREVIPVGEATDSDFGEFLDAVWGDL